MKNIKFVWEYCAHFSYGKQSSPWQDKHVGKVEELQFGSWRFVLVLFSSVLGSLVFSSGFILVCQLLSEFCYNCHYSVTC